MEVQLTKSNVCSFLPRISTFFGFWINECLYKSFKQSQNGEIISFLRKVFRCCPGIEFWVDTSSIFLFCLMWHLWDQLPNSTNETKPTVPQSQCNLTEQKGQGNLLDENNTGQLEEEEKEGHFKEIDFFCSYKVIWPFDNRHWDIKYSCICLLAVFVTATG